MLALRLVRGSRPLALARRLVLVAAACGVGVLLLSALAYAVAHPDNGRDAAVRLAWCALPVAATAQLAVAVARADPAGRPRSGLVVAGARGSGLAAASGALAGLLGSAVGALLFWHLRGDLADGPLAGAAADALPAGGPLPVAAAVTLLTVVPATAAAAGALALRGGRRRVPARPAVPAGTPGAALPSYDDGVAGRAEQGTPLPAGLPWGTALATAGTALSAYAGDGPASDPADRWLPLPGALGQVAPGVVGGWLLIAAGLVLAGPGVVHLSGLFLTAGRPGALRLLSGRALQEEAGRLGRPLGALTASVAAVLAAAQTDGLGLLGPLGTLGAGIVLVCALVTAATAVGESRADRRPVAELLLRLGAPRRLLRGSVVVRLAAVTAVFLPLTWLAALLLVLPAPH